MPRSAFSRKRTGSTRCSTRSSPGATSSPTTIPSLTSRSGRGSRASNGTPSISSNISTFGAGTRPSLRVPPCRRATRFPRTWARSRCRSDGVSRTRRELLPRPRNDDVLLLHQRAPFRHVGIDVAGELVGRLRLWLGAELGHVLDHVLLAPDSDHCLVELVDDFLRSMRRRQQ